MINTMSERSMPLTGSAMLGPRVDTRTVSLTRPLAIAKRAITTQITLALRNTQ